MNGQDLLSESPFCACRRETHARPRTLFAVGIVLALLALVVIPWNRTIPLPATLESAQSPSLYAPQGAQVAEISVTNDTTVEQGQPLIKLVSPDLKAEIRQATTRVLQARLKVIQAATLRERAEDRLALELELDRVRQPLDRLRQDQARLTLTAPVAGQVVDIPPSLSTATPHPTTPPPVPLRIRTGTATVQGTPQSTLSHAWRASPPNPMTFTLPNHG